MSKPIGKSNPASPAGTRDYSGLVGGIGEFLEAARCVSARTVNEFMTATYWEIGRRIVEFEQGGEKRAEYGEALLERLSKDLTQRHGRGFTRPNLIRFRQSYLAFPANSIRSTLSNEFDIPKPPQVSTALLALLPVEICRTASGIAECLQAKRTGSAGPLAVSAGA